jgi:hypothetical protein
VGDPEFDKHQVPSLHALKNFAERGKAPYLPPQKVVTPGGEFWQNSAKAKLAMMMATPEVFFLSLDRKNRIP